MHLERLEPPLHTPRPAFFKSRAPPGTLAVTGHQVKRELTIRSN